MKTYTAKVNEIKRNWYLIDAKDKILGRVATQAAIIIRGKHKKDYTANFDMGDFVVIINAKFTALSGKKLEQKKYFRHSGYPGGLKSESLKNLIKTKPTEPLNRAIIGMIPENRLKTNQIKRIKIYADENHKHTQKLIPTN
ncbi:50S ribosomal protein L13 [Patescibacteria group bacterium]|nr:50S ribosomal protein L13 [Patescibacteria group bacterium]